MRCAVFPFHFGCHASHFDRDGIFWIKCTFYLRNSKNITRCDDDNENRKIATTNCTCNVNTYMLPHIKLINIKIWNDYEFRFSIAMIMVIFLLFFHKNLTTKLIQVLNFWHKWNTRSTLAEMKSVTQNGTNKTLFLFFPYDSLRWLARLT